MRTYHEQLLEQVMTERDRILSRRQLFKGGLGVAAGAAALSLVGSGGFKIAPALAQDTKIVKDDVEVLNYALTLEHLENAFYRDGVGQFTYGMDGHGNDIGTWLMAIGSHEQAHVDTLTKVILIWVASRWPRPKYDFGYTDAASSSPPPRPWRTPASCAYDGAGQYLTNLDLITAAGSIVAVEARHAAYLNLITGADPAPAASSKRNPSRDPRDRRPVHRQVSGNSHQSKDITEMQTIQQRTERLVWNRLSARPAGRVITLAAIGGATMNSGYARARMRHPRPSRPRSMSSTMR